MDYVVLVISSFDSCWRARNNFYIMDFLRICYAYNKIFDPPYLAHQDFIGITNFGYYF